jgi:hypothetical protein
MIAIKSPSTLLASMAAALSSIAISACGGSSDSVPESTDPAPLYDEASSGDITNDPSNPLRLQLATGANRLNASVVSPDLDYVSINVPADTELTGIKLNRYDSTNTQSFIALQPGTEFTELAASPNVANLLGHAHFGIVSLGLDILPVIGTGPGAQMFTPPLAAGDYTFWIQETGTDLVDFSITFEVEAAP